MSAPPPPDEAARLRALRSYQILDTAPEPSFDRVTALVSRILDVPIALVSLVDAERQWFKSCVGLGDVRQTGRDVAFCAYAIHANDVFLVEDAKGDPRFADNPLVTGPPHIGSYAGAPLVTPEGARVGTLCALDTRPRDFTGEQLATLVDLAAMVVSQMELRRLVRERKLFERVSKLSPNLVYLVDAQQRRTAWSNRPEEFRGAGLADIFHPEDVERAAAHMMRSRAIADGEHNEGTFRVRTADGDYRWMLARETPFARDDHGSVIEVLGIATDVTALKEAEARLSSLAVTDELTRLPNRRAMRERLELLALEAARGRRFSVAIADIDFFKKVNDTHGHAAGDAVLVAVAAALKATVRRSDLVARMGGEEFCIVQTDVDPEQMIMLTERLRAVIASISEPLTVTASFGVCHSTTVATPDEMLAAADEALYRAKRSGRNRVEVA